MIILTLHPTTLPSESRIDSLTPSSIETENIPNSSTSIPSTDLPKHKGYAWIPDTSTLNKNEIIGDIDSQNILNNSRRNINSINSVSCLNPDPKTYLQAIHNPENYFCINAMQSEHSQSLDALQSSLSFNTTDYHLGVQKENQQRWKYDKIQSPIVYKRF
ncbi:hypothetical protein O181_033578 [Austropuccinia psidii MF-1]|uniref:Uncharacterized protein n=1 Tax=Austropuccinia psidii MF-1 TaxID=1389203 RepID=A0A9Q3D1S4_9BASI|nr:hypothetical protein [Austropuccinia psidii MF-1]